MNRSWKHTITTKWFFTELHPLFKQLTFFIKGDLLVLLPLVLIILLTGFISGRFMTMMIGVYVAIRYLGEMIYWFSHQFGKQEYRPHDFGFKNLNNHALYILYQTLAIAGTTVGVGIFLYAFLYL